MAIHTDHPLLTHFMRTARNGVWTPPTSQVWDAKVWILQDKTQINDWPTEGLITPINHKPSNGKGKKEKRLYIIPYLDENQARKIATSRGKFEDEPVEWTVRKLFDEVEGNFIYGGFTFYHQGHERRIRLDPEDVTRYYDSSHGESFEGDYRDYIRGMPKRTPSVKRDVMRKICEELDTIGIPMGVEIYAVDGLKGIQSFIHLSPSRPMKKEEAPRLEKSIRSLKAGIAQSCVFIANDPPELVRETESPDPKSPKTTTTCFSESYGQGVVSFELTGESVREVEHANGITSKKVEEPKSEIPESQDPLYEHRKGDSPYLVVTPMSEETLNLRLYVPRLKVPEDGFSYDFTSKTEMGGSLTMMNVYLYQNEALKRCKWNKCEDEPDNLTVRELLAIANEQKIGIDFHFLPDEDAYRRTHLDNEDALVDSSCSISYEEVEIYHNFVEQGTPVPETRADFIRCMTKAEGVLTKKVHDLILDSLSGLSLPGDFDLYYINRLGYPCVVLDLIMEEQITDDQYNVLNTAAQALEKKIGIGVLAFSVAGEQTPRPDRDQEPVFKEEEKTTFTLPLPRPALQIPVSGGAPIAAGKVPALSRELVLPKPKAPFRLPGLDTDQ